MSKRKDLTGLKFGLLTVIKVTPSRFSGNRKRGFWECHCDCGKIIEVESSHLYSGHTTTCGCVRNEKIKQLNLTHGKCNSTEYGSYQAAKNRCFNEKTERYPDYGGRGIIMCERWVNSFGNFLLDMGNKPTIKHSLERRNNDKGYEPSNCYWATPKEQNQNKRTNVYYEYNDDRLTIAQWAIKINVPYSKLNHLIKRIGFILAYKKLSNEPAA